MSLGYSFSSGEPKRLKCFVVPYTVMAWRRLLKWMKESQAHELGVVIDECQKTRGVKK
jgi:hypothetical protein